MIHQPIIGSIDQSDPDAMQALRDALPIMAELADARAMKTPKSDRAVEAHGAYIRELEARLKLKAEKASCPVDEFEQAAFSALRRVRQKQGLPAPSAIVRFDPRGADVETSEQREARFQVSQLGYAIIDCEKLIEKHTKRLARLKADKALAERRLGGAR